MIRKLTKGAFAALVAAMLLLPFNTVQAGIPVGTWRSHPAYSNATFSLNAFSCVFVLSDGGLYFFDPADNGLYTIDRTGGLSDTDISRIAYCDSEKAILLVYSNGNIDILYENETIYNFTDLKNAIGGPVTIGNIKVYGNQAYIPTSEGVYHFDIRKKEIRETYKFESPAKNVEIFNDTILCGTDNGLFLARTSDNLSDPGNWTLFIRKNFKDIFTFDGKLMGWSWEDRVWTIDKNRRDITLVMDSVESVSYGSDKLFLIKDTLVNVFYSISDIRQLEFDSRVNHINSNSNTWWVSQGIHGLSRYELKDNIPVCKAKEIRPDSPRRNLFNYITWPEQNRMLVVSGCPNYSGIDYPGSIMIYENDRWSYLDEDIESHTGVKYINLSTVVQDPNDRNHYFAGSMRQGLYEFKDSKFYKLHSWDNSPLTSILDHDRSDYVNVECLAYDRNGYLWMTNNEVDTIINVMKPDSTWFKLYYPQLSGGPSYRQMTIDENGYIWFVSARGLKIGLYCLDTNNTPENNSDDRLKYSGDIFTNQDGTSEEIYDIYFYQRDLNDEMWLGTNRGIFVLKNPSEFISEDNVVFERVKISRNDGSDLADYLFNGVMTTAIFIDQGNRKWIGTLNDGVFLLNPDGTEVLEHFTQSNSPLPSDYIVSISQNGSDGSVFFCTDKGMVEYGGMARNPENELSKSNLSVYPNPVKSDFYGYVSITGMTSESSVRIVNTSGRLVNAGMSNGGQYSWNLTDTNGRQVPSGIYHAIVTNLENSKSESIPITVIR